MKNGCILIIDDDPVMRELLPLLLGTEGYTVTAYHSVHSALASFARIPAGSQPSVILTDLNLHGDRDPGLASRLRSALPEAVSLIAMSASQPTPEEVAAFDAFLMKPFTLSDFDSAFQSGQARRYAGDNRAASIEDTPQTPTAASELDPVIYEKLLAIMGPEQLGTMYTMLSQDAETRIGRMRSAVSAGDEISFTQEAHAIKGASGMLGAASVHALASQMEQEGLSRSTLLPELGTALMQLRRILENTATERLVNTSPTRP